MSLIESYINVNPQCGGAYVRFYYNGWHYWLFNERYETNDSVETLGIQALEKFSNISKIEKPTGKRIRKYILMGQQGVAEKDFAGLKNILQSEKTELWINGIWFEIEINREVYRIRPQPVNAFDVIFQAEILQAAALEQRLSTFTPGQIVDPEVPANITLETLAGSAGQVSIMVTGGFNIQIVGNTSIVEYGMEYRTTGIPWTKQVKGGTLLFGIFWAAITGLTPATTYQYRAYVKDNFNYYYGDTKTITTQSGSIILGFGAQQMSFFLPEPTTTDYYRLLTYSGIPPNVSIKVNINLNFAATDLEAFAFYRINGEHWRQFKHFTASGEDDIAIPLTGAFAKDMIVDLRLVLASSNGGNGTLTATITGGSVVSGTANISVGTNDTFTIDFPDSSI